VSVVAARGLAGTSQYKPVGEGGRTAGSFHSNEERALVDASALRLRKVRRSYVCRAFQTSKDCQSHRRSTDSARSDTCQLRVTPELRLRRVRGVAKDNLAPVARLRRLHRRSVAPLPVCEGDTSKRKNHGVVRFGHASSKVQQGCLRKAFALAEADAQLEVAGDN
jgi:hypothetical protein